MQKGQTGILILAGIVLLVIVAAGAYYLGKSSSTQPTSVVSQPTPTSNPSDETANWKTYYDQKIGINFKYPNNFQVYKSGKDDLYVATFKVGKYVDPNLPGVPSSDRIDVHIQTKDSTFLIDERTVLFNLKIGESGDISPINTKQFGKGWLFTRLPDIQVDNLVAKSFISDGVWQAPSGSVEKRVYIQRGNFIYMIRGYIIGGDINEQIFDNLVKTLKFLDSETSSE